MLLIRNKCTKVQLRGKQLLSKKEWNYIFNVYFLCLVMYFLHVLCEYNNQWCVQGEASEALASGPPFLGAPLTCYACKFSLFLMKNLLLFTHINVLHFTVMYYSTLLSKGPLAETVMCRYFTFKGAPTGTAILQFEGNLFSKGPLKEIVMCKYSAFKGPLQKL